MRQDDVPVSDAAIRRDVGLRGGRVHSIPTQVCMVVEWRSGEISVELKIPIVVTGPC